MEIEEGVICRGHYKAEADDPLRDLHNSSYDTKAEFTTVLLVIQNNS